jgi:hypothetical protein
MDQVDVINVSGWFTLVFWYYSNMNSALEDGMKMEGSSQKMLYNGENKILNDE